MKRSIVILFILLATRLYGAGFSSLFTNNMVLQQNTTTKIWGWVEPDKQLYLRASWNGENINMNADSKGYWSVGIITPKGGFEPHSITLCDESGNEISSIKNVLIGEVWLASGQSNMEMILRDQPQWKLYVENSTQEIASANYPYIRFTTLARKESFLPVAEAQISTWKVCSPESAGDMSAVSYFYARELFKKLNIPVGMVVSSYGGSPIQSWIPTAKMEMNPIYKKDLIERSEEVAVSYQSEDEYIENLRRWVDDSESTAKGSSEVPIEMVLPINLEHSSVGNQIGEVVFRKEIEIADPSKGELRICLGTMDDIGRVYFNGELVWEELRNSRSYSQVEFTVQQGKIKAGNNVIEVRVLNTLWGGGLTGPYDRLFYKIGDGEMLSLAGEWSYSKAFDMNDVAPIPREGKPLFSTAASLYNGMIYPIIGFAFRGAIWYQGESNTGSANTYVAMMEDLVKSWREDFGNDLPFYFAQIAPYKYDNPRGYIATELMESQARAASSISNSGMAITIDLGDPENIHPAKKRQVGERLAMLALANTYKIQSPVNYPTFSRSKVEGDKVILSFTNTYDSIISKTPLAEFEVSADGTSYEQVKAMLISGENIVLTSTINNPKYLRYCWHNASCGTIFNSKQMPLAPFSTKLQ